MSANEKDLRAARQAERREKKSAAAAEQEKKDRRYRRNAIIVVAVLLVLIIGALVINSDLFYTKTTALTVGSTKYTPAEVTYFYRSTLNNVYQNISSQLGDMASMVLDTSTSLRDQPYPYSEDGSQSWADVIMETAREDIRRITVLSEAAEKEGMTLSEADQATITGSLTSLQDYASASGYANLDKFLAAYYGKGMDVKTFTKLQERTLLASNYSDALVDSLQYTDEQLADYYNAHADELDYYDYYIYSVLDTMDQFAGLEGDALKEKMHETAATIASADDAQGFLAAIEDFTGEPAVLNVNALHADSLSTTYADWLTDPARQPGDTTVIDTDSGACYALYFVGLDHNDYHTADFRHILVMAEADDNGEYTDEALFAAEAKAREIYAEWKEDPTEEHFISLANELSEDTGSNTNGGLYEQVAKYVMVPGVNDFLFAEGRAAGDTAVVLGRSSSYAGYHVVYYVGENDLNANILSEDLVRDEDYYAKYDELSAAYPVQEGSGMRFVDY